ncbi:cyclic nucleotide-binding domain-containing protein [Myxococcota bacterium]|nr:cyclic nucleotide-binding domain-containing protein [Myxococcota bacterium]
MSDTALAVFNEAENNLRQGRFNEALVGYLRVVRGVPSFLRARFRIGDALLNFKANKEAHEVYNQLAWHAIKAGDPLTGLVAIKMAALLDPSSNEVIDILATLYSKDSDRIGPSTDALPRRLLKDDDQAGEVNGLAGADLIAAATSEAANYDHVTDYSDKLPSIPLFSFLEEDAFTAVLQGLQLRRHSKGQDIIQQGKPGDSFFLLSDGHVDVLREMGGRQMRLAQLRAGAVFGEMALISKAPRTATVKANDDCDLLELKRSSLEDQATKLASVTQALKDFTHDRFLANLAATSALFKPFPRSIRTEIIKKFRDFPVDPGDELIEEGEEGQGIFLILKGAVSITKQNDDGTKMDLATLKEGDVFGEISLINDSPTTATCTAKTRGELLFLPKRDFNAIVMRHPEMKDELAKITADRIKKNKDLMLDEDDFEILEDDDLIML